MKSSAIICAECGAAEYESLDDTSMGGGILQPGIMSREACLHVCTQNPGCVAADVQEASEGVQDLCWLHMGKTNPDITMTVTGVQHNALVNQCPPAWG